MLYLDSLLLNILLMGTLMCWLTAALLGTQSFVLLSIAVLAALRLCYGLSDPLLNRALQEKQILCKRE